VFGTLALDFYNGKSGRCDPGFRAIAAKARVGLGTVSASLRRLVTAGWISRTRFLRYAHGSLRWCFRFALPSEPPSPRSEFATKPIEVRKRGSVDKFRPQPPARSVAQQLALLATWQKDWRPSGAALASSSATKAA
jgi:hypothetical protein